MPRRVVGFAFAARLTRARYTFGATAFADAFSALLAVGRPPTASRAIQLLALAMLASGVRAVCTGCVPGCLLQANGGA